MTIAKQQYFTLSALDYGNPKGEQNYSEMEKEIAELKKENEELKAQIQANAYRPQYPVQTENTTAYSPPPVQKNIPVANSSNAYFTRLRSNFEVLSSKQLSDPSINQFKICRLSLVVNNNHIHEKEFLKSKIRVATSIDKKAIIISNGDFLSGMSNDFFSEYQVNRNDLRYIPEQGEIQCIFPNFTIEEVMPARTTPGCIYIDFLYSDN